MQKKFLDNFYDVLFVPEHAFDDLNNNPNVKQGLRIVVFISILSYLLHMKFPSDIGAIALTTFRILALSFSGIISWIIFAAFLEMVAAIFKKNGKLKELLTLTAFALAPWIFLAPIELFRTTNFISNFVGILLSLIVWLWTTVLIVVSVMKAYNLSLGRTLVLLVLPFAGGIIAFNWIVGFFATLGGILGV